MDTTNSETKKLLIQFFEENVYLKANQLVEVFVSHNLFPWEDVINLYECDEGERNVQEIFEWYIVSEYLFDALENVGEPVVEFLDTYYMWGRTCTGQDPWVDSSILEAYKQTHTH